MQVVCIADLVFGVVFCAINATRVMRSKPQWLIYSLRVQL